MVLRYCVVEDGVITNTVAVEEGSDWQPKQGMLVPENEARALYPCPEPPVALPPMRPMIEELFDRVEALENGV